MVDSQNCGIEAVVADLASANTAVSLTIPGSARTATIQARGAVDLIVGATQASVNTGSPPGPFFTIKAGSKIDVLKVADRGGADLVLWLACATASQKAEAFLNKVL